MGAGGINVNLTLLVFGKVGTASVLILYHWFFVKKDATYAGQWHVLTSDFSR